MPATPFDSSLCVQAKGGKPICNGWILWHTYVSYTQELVIVCQHMEFLEGVGWQQGNGENCYSNRKKKYLLTNYNKNWVLEGYRTSLVVISG